MFYIDKDTELTTKHLQKYIEIFRTQHLPKLKINKAYHDVKNPSITNRTVVDETQPNNKIANPIIRYVNVMLTNYFMGKPVSYIIKDEELATIISANNNKENPHNFNLAMDCSIYGMAYELLYLNDNKQLNFSRINPETVIPIYSNEIDGELLYAIRFWEDTDILTDKTTTNVELYSNEDIKIFKEVNKALTLKEVKKHYFKMCPINIFKNNKEMTSDGQPIQKLVDCYDFATSDSLNNFDSINNAYLCIYNSGFLSDEDLNRMKSNRIFAIDSGDGSQSKVEYITKNNADMESEVFKQRVENDWKRFSYVADLESISKSHVSATSIRNGSFGVESITTLKENQFRTSLMRRLQIICNVYNLFGANYNTENIKLIFLRNIPQDLGNIADVMSKMTGIISNKTILQNIPFVQNVDEELKQLEEEKKLNYHNENEQNNNQIIQDN